MGACSPLPADLVKLLTPDEIKQSPEEFCHSDFEDASQGSDTRICPASSCSLLTAIAMSHDFAAHSANKECYIGDYLLLNTIGKGSLAEQQQHQQQLVEPQREPPMKTASIQAGQPDGGTQPLPLATAMLPHGPQSPVCQQLCFHCRCFHMLKAPAWLAPADGMERLGPAPAMGVSSSAALIAPQEQGVVDKPSGVIRTAATACTC
ncbi:hypothetical protein QTO34_016199 [Cnephaeus nilssonii]|uniref:Uncharacterized protein n=1 Tax=Cnephaeus nilssonii TaxID=3371016 RepID=A0AA40I5M7_CNENI|nr:hypothetical protein QTO34_016199 [Eptesicus nilssonii]